MDAKYDFYEIVIIKQDNSLPQYIHRKEGVVLGKAQDENGSWYYTVSLPIDNNQCWSFSENQLEKTGKKKQRSDFYDGKSLKVKANEPINGDNT